VRSAIFTNEFEKDCRNIPVHIKSRADSIVALLQKNPIDIKLAVKKLTNIHPPVWRVRIGSYRLLYMFDDSNLILLKFKHRKDIYRSV